MTADANYRRALERAWRVLQDAIDVAEGQGRTYHVRKLQRAALIVTEAQMDVTATERALRPRGAHPSPDWLRGTSEQAE